MSDGRVEAVVEQLQLMSNDAAIAAARPAAPSTGAAPTAKPVTKSRFAKFSFRRKSKTDTDTAAPYVCAACNCYL